MAVSFAILLISLLVTTLLWHNVRRQNKLRRSHTLPKQSITPEQLYYLLTHEND